MWRLGRGRGQGGWGVSYGNPLDRPQSHYSSAFSFVLKIFSNAQINSIGMCGIQHLAHSRNSPIDVQFSKRSSTDNLPSMLKHLIWSEVNRADELEETPAAMLSRAVLG